MPWRTFFQVDAFTTKAFEGNPAAVVGFDSGEILCKKATAQGKRSISNLKYIVIDRRYHFVYTRAGDT